MRTKNLPMMVFAFYGLASYVFADLDPLYLKVAEQQTQSEDRDNVKNLSSPKTSESLSRISFSG
jgi:hypothetical protein